MLKIYTSKEIAKQQSKISDIVPDIEARFNLIFTDKNKMFRDKTSELILKQIEGMTKRYNSDVIEGKFGAVSLSDISEGGKALLLLSNYSKSCIINIDPLGYNCIYLLFQLANSLDIEVVSTRILYHMKPGFEAIVNGEKCRGMDISFKMEEYDEQ